MKQKLVRGPLVILSFDAADSRLLDQWTKEGYLPTLKGLIERGVHSELTGPELVSENGIWVSVFSGLSRAQHGYYYWRPLKPGSYELELSDQRVDNAVPFWGQMSDTHMRVAAIDVPETHCISGVSGVQIANWAPHNARFEGYSIPSSLFSDLRRQFGPPLGVEERAGGTRDEDERMYTGLLNQIQQKAVICRHLLSRGEFDLIIIGFHESHIAGHQFWKYSDRSSAPVRDGAHLKHATRDVYQAIDRAFGEVLQQAGQDSAAIVVSNMGLQEDYPNLELTRAFCRQLRLSSDAERFELRGRCASPDPADDPAILAAGHQ